MNTKSIGMKKYRKRRQYEMVRTIRQFFVQRREKADEEKRVRGLVHSSNCIGTTCSLYITKPERIFTGHLLNGQKRHC